jgi:hypothetical protein
MAELNFHTLISRADNVLAASVDGEIVLMSIERGSYYGLENTARCIWDLLESPKRLEDLCALIKQKYRDKDGIIDRDVMRFVAEMANEAIVVLT